MPKTPKKDPGRPHNQKQDTDPEIDVLFFNGTQFAFSGSSETLIPRML